MTEQNQLNWQRTNLDNIEQAWEGDLWDRKRLGVQLTNYVDRLNCGAVLALDARWGEGKTWFVRHWKKHLEDENHNVIYLDAFANDYLEDPFLVISSEIASKLDQTADKRLVHKFKKAAAVLQQGLLTQAPTIIASMISFALTGGIIPFLKIDNDSIKDKYEDIVDKVTDNIGEKVTEAIQKKIDDYEEEKQSLNAFKETLAKLAESLDRPLVFIIDELDRCRPDFAIRLIERIKHFFDIPKIVFVLVIDKKQFSKVVCHNYGYDEKLGEEYLDKFVDFSIILKRNSIFAYYKEVRQVIEIYLEKIGFFENIVPNGVVGLISALHIYKKTNLRQLRKILNQVSLYKLDTDIKNEFLVYLLFNKNNLEEFTISSIKEDLMKLAEYCLVEDIIGYESGIPENLSEARRDYIKEQLFKSEINSGLLELFIKNLKKKDQEYFKFSDGIEELFIDDLYSNDTFLEKWKTYLNI